MNNSITFLVIWVASGLITYVIAQNKGRNPILALAFGLLFGFIAVVYYLIAKGSKEYELKKTEKKLAKLKNDSS